jgi:Amt family ammonium transporter
VLATGVFASKAVNPGGADGLIHGNPRLLLVQLLAVAVVSVFAGVMTALLYKGVDGFLGMRVPRKEEIVGLDISQHKESGYTVIE